DGDRVALVAVPGDREVEGGGGGAGDGGAVLLPLVAVGDGVAVGVRRRRRRGQRLVGGRRGRGGREAGDDRRRVRDRRRRRGEDASVFPTRRSSDLDGDRVALVAVPGDREVERGGGRAGDGGAVLLPLVAVGDGVAVGVRGRGRRGQRLVGRRRGRRHRHAGDRRSRVRDRLRVGSGGAVDGAVVRCHRHGHGIPAVAVAGGREVERVGRGARAARRLDRRAVHLPDVGQRDRVEIGV